MTKHKEKEEDIIEQKDMQKEIEEELMEIKNEEAENLSGDSKIEEKSAELTELEKLEKQARENLDGWKRAQADFENYKKGQVEASKNLMRYMIESIVLQIIPVIDNFQMSVAHIPEKQKNDPWVTGIMHIQKQLADVLKDNGVLEIEVKVGENFNPELHEAIEDKKCEECEEREDQERKFKNRIKKIVSKGYKMENKVIRPTRVIVE